MNICLIGNPNCGKTTLFNALTGTYQKTGNFSGVTTEKKQGKYKKDKDVDIIDLPGIYSLSPESSDEKAVTEYLKTQTPDVIINLLDGTNLARNLYLTCMLSSLKIPTVIAVNFSDELDKNGIFLDVKKMQEIFNVPIIKVSAIKNKNLDLLIQTCKKGKRYLPDVADDCHKFIDGIIDGIIKNEITKCEKNTIKLDKILLNKYLGLPIFFCVVTAVYFLSIKVGGFLGKYISDFFLSFSERTAYSLTLIGAKGWLISLICDAVFNGVGTVISFLPQILVLFFMLTVIEESGYSARIAFLMDGILKKFGLGGKSFIPIMLSCGCSVTGIYGTRTIENEGQKIMTVFLSPFMPCGAKLAVFGWLSGVLFNGNPLIATSTYFLSIFSIIVFGNILKKFKPFRDSEGGFLIEMPLIRKPSVKDIFFVLYEKTKDFLVKSGSVIFAVSVCLWLLKNFGFCGYVGENATESFLYILGNIFKYLFYPLGFFNCESAVAILSGIFAKEGVIESLTFLSTDVHSLFNNGYSAYAFIAFILLSPPCIASILTAKRELKSKKLLFYMLIFQTASAYTVALLINLIGIIISAHLLLTCLFVIIITVLFFSAIKLSVKGCNNCKMCRNKLCKKK